MSDHTTPPTPTKHCPKCNIDKPATSEYFYRDNRPGRGGWQYWCKACHSKYNNAYNAAHEAERSEAGRVYYRANKERILKYWHAYHAEHKEYYAEHNRKWFAEHKDRIPGYNRKWRKANPVKTRVRNNRRRVYKLQAQGSHTAEDVERQYKAQRGKCYYCGCKTGKSYHTDHVVPLSRGGSDNPENLVIACRKCNTSKNNKLPHEWPQGNRLL